MWADTCSHHLFHGNCQVVEISYEESKDVAWRQELRSNLTAGSPACKLSFTWGIIDTDANSLGPNEHTYVIVFIKNHEAASMGELFEPQLGFESDRYETLICCWIC